MQRYLHKISATAIYVALALIICHPAIADEEKHPYFASVGVSEANMRVGPGFQYRIKWVMVRRHMPVKITSSFGPWRKVVDIQGDEGWVHQTMIRSRRTSIITEREVVLRREDKQDSAGIARLRKGVLVRVLSCKADACRIKIDRADSSYKGWIDKSSLWGVSAGEEF